MNKTGLLDALNLALPKSTLKDRIDKITEENISSISNLPANEIVPFVNMLGMVAYQKLYSTLFSREDNPYANLFQERLPVGAELQDVYVDLIEGTVPDWEGKADFIFSTKRPKVYQTYHSFNFEKQYKVTTTYAEACKAFLSLDGVESLTAKILGTLTSSTEFDLMLRSCDLISTMLDDGAFKMFYDTKFDTKENIEEFMEKFQNSCDDIKFMNDKYNMMGLTTKTRDEDLVVFIKPKFKNRVGIKLLAAAFNMSQADFKKSMVLVPDDYGFGKGKDDIALVAMDRRMFKAHNQIFEITAQFVPSNLSTNNFLTERWMFSYGRFFNGFAFSTKSAPERKVTSTGSIPGGTVSCSPETAKAGTEITVTVNPGASMKLKPNTLHYVNPSIGIEFPIDEKTKKFKMPDYDVTVSCEFESNK